MPLYLRQSTASQEVPLGPFVDSTDAVTAETGLTIANTDIKMWKAGATTLADKNSGGATHISGGVYYCILDATDTDTIGPLVLFVAVSGALAVRVECVVLDEAVYDVLFGTTAPSTYAGADTSGTTTLLSRIGSALTITSGRVTANVDQLNGTSIAGTGTRVADSFVAMFNVASPVFTVASVNQSGDAYGVVAVGLDSNAAINATVSSLLSLSLGTTGTVDATGATATAFRTNLTEVDDYWNDAVLVFTSGTLAGQSRTILDFDNTNGLVTLDEALTAAPANGVAFAIRADHVHPVTQIAQGVRTELATELGRLDVAVSSRLAAASYAAPLDAAGTRAAVGLAAANLDTQLDALPTNAELATALASADDAVLAAIAALNNVSAAQVATAVLTTAMTEAYRSAGATATLAQFAYEVLAHLGESSISGTTKTLKKLDGATTAKTYTLDSATTPTAITEAT